MDDSYHVEILCEVDGSARQRVVSRDVNARYALLEKKEDGRFHVISSLVTLNKAFALATATLAGDSKALTWPHAQLDLAVAFVAVGLVLGLEPVPAAGLKPGGSEAPAAVAPPTAAGADPRMDVDEPSLFGGG